jgi:hypothetical protein
MTEVLQANIFFIIASCATVVFCIVVTMIMFQIYKILKTVRSILERINSASETMSEDVAHVRQLVATGGLVSTVIGLVFGSAKKRNRTKKASEDD